MAYSKPTKSSVINDALQQKMSLYAKWFHWMLNELTSHNDWNLMGK